MNEVGAMLIGVAVRATAFSLAGMVLYGLLRRKGPAAGSLVAVATLLMLVAVSLSSLGSWPRWWTVGPRAAVASAQPEIGRDHEVRNVSDGAVKEAAAPRLAGEPAAEPHAAITAKAIWEEVLRASSPAPAPRWTWRAWVGLLCLAGSLAGLVRLGLGVREVRALRIGSRPVDDPRLLDEVEILRAETSCVRPVALRASGAITTPATIGWLRPMILLPPTWHEWDDREARVVLAHELAHVCRNDYLWGLLAHVSVALHFAHPLAHWLLDRMRLQQELAADAWGAELAGGNPHYLTTLAQMALRQADRPVRWPARAFLPTRGTFLRRIEMLRDVKTLPRTSLSRAFRGGTVATLAALGLAIVGIRGVEAPREAMAQAPPAAPPAAAPGAAEKPYDLADVPEATDMLIGVRASVLASQPAFRPVLEAVTKPDLAESPLNLPYAELDQVLLLWLRPSRDAARRRPDSDLSSPSAVILKSAKPRDWKALTAHLLGQTAPVVDEGRTFDWSIDRQSHWCAFRRDDRTLMLGAQADLSFLLRASRNPANHNPWDEAWKQVDQGQITIAFGAGWLGQRLQPGSGNGVRDPNPQLDAFAPLWTDARGYAFGLDFSRELTIDAVAVTANDDGVERVDRTARALMVLFGNLYEKYRRTIDAAPREALGKMQFLADTVEPLLKNVRWDAKPRLLHARTGSSVDIRRLVQELLPAAAASQGAARRTRSMTNLKMIGLALFNYATDHGDRFPPAVVIGPDGKTPHSWRVAILPYFEQKTCYDEYKLDEPWDGPNNRKLLEKMPAVYRYGDDDTTPNPAYFAVVGPETVLGVAGGVEFKQIKDGTFNTILIVESKRDIPWTKPEDIPYDANGPFPQLGGYTPRGFLAVLADGAVRFIHESVDQKVLRALFTYAGRDNHHDLKLP